MILSRFLTRPERDPRLELLQLLAGAIHRALAHGLFVLASFIRVDDDHAHLGIARSNFLGLRAWRIGLPLLSIDAGGTIDPLGLVEEVEPSLQLAVAPPIQSDHEPVMRALERLEILRRHHAAVPDKHDAAEAKSLLQVANDLLNRVVINAVSGPDVMGDRPARDHHHADHDLNIVRLAVATVTVFGEVFGAGTLEVRAGDVVKDQIWLEAEEVAEAVVERLFDPLLGLVQLIERAIPGVELAGMHPHPIALVPVRHEAAPHAIADEVGLQPTGQSVFAGGTDQPIGDEHKRSVGERYIFGSPQTSVEDVPEAELLEEGPDGEHRPPRGGIDDLELCWRCFHPARYLRGAGAGAWEESPRVRPCGRGRRRPVA